MIAILGGALLTLSAIYAARRAIDLERPLAWYWLTGFGTWALAGLAAVIAFLGAGGPTPLYIAVTQLATLIGGMGFVIAAATQLIRPLPELWVNIAFLTALGIMVAGQVFGLAGPAGLFTLVIQIALVGLGASQYRAKGRPAMMIAIGGAGLILAPMSARFIPAGEIRFLILFGMAAIAIYFLSDAVRGEGTEDA